MAIYIKRTGESPYWWNNNKNGKLSIEDAIAAGEMPFDGNYNDLRQLLDDGVFGPEDEIWDYDSRRGAKLKGTFASFFHLNESIEKLFDKILRESSQRMTITDIKLLKKTLADLGYDAYEDGNEELSFAYSDAQLYCEVVIRYLRNKDEESKNKVVSYWKTPDDYYVMPFDEVVRKVNLPEFDQLGNWVVDKLIKTPKPKKEMTWDYADSKPKYCFKQASKKTGIKYTINYVKDEQNWSVILDTEDEYDADEFRDAVDELLVGLNSGAHSYDDIEGLGDVHIGVAQFYEVSEDSYEDLDESYRDKYVVYCEPSSKYKARRAMDW